MSYILEALKKAQAERQIGEMPTIHAPPMAPAAPEARGLGSRKPVMVAIGLLGGAVVVLGAMLLRQPSSAPVAPDVATPAVQQPSSPTQAVPIAASLVPSAAEPTAAVSTVTGVRPVSSAQPSASPVQPTTAAGSTVAGMQPVSSAQPSAIPVQPATSAVPDVASAQPSASPAQRAPAASPVAADPPVAQLPDLAKPRVAAAQAGDAPVEPKKRARAADLAAATVKAPAATPAAPTPAPEEYIQSQRELPEPIQRAIPQIAMGGYMYSKNPADRLLLIDKVLRKEGDEVAPGLQLEKLMPKAAVFSFRGYRYKVPL